MNPRLLLAATLLLPALAPARTLGELEFSPCTLTAESGLPPVEAWCSQLEVPEDRSAPDGRRISLALAWIGPAAGASEPDPVFLLAGGPGQSARDSYPSTAGAFSEILKQRNVILLDQRGTGGSNALQCESDEQDWDQLDPTPEYLADFTRQCLEKLSSHADVRHYTTTDAVADLEAVRQALGAETINLVGVSYGTRVAQQYTGAHPERVRSVVLDGVVPNTLVLGQEHAANLEDSLAAQFLRCQQDPGCSTALGDPRQHLQTLKAELQAQPRPVRYRDATTGQVHEGRFSWPMLSALLRMYAYQPAVASTLPLLLHELAQGQTDAAMAQAKMLLGSLGGSMAHGMGLSVSCSEDADELRVDPDDAGSVLGTEFIEYSQAQCAVWPRGTRPDDFRQPLSTDTPVLLLSGELDPVTPARYGEQVLEGLDHGVHLVLRGQGHNVIGAGCMPRLMAQFIESADAKSLETECLDRLSPTPPFSGYHGWEP